MTFDKLLDIPPYSLDKNEKKRLLTARIKELTLRHMEGCPEYKRILDSVGFDPKRTQSYEDYPFLPVRLFKELDLKSVPQDEIFKTMTSSGTSGQAVSKIYLDRQTAGNQQKAMVKIVNDFTGSGRMPMIIIDCPSVIKNRAMFSARGAGILGFSIFGAKKIYALDDDMRLDIEGVRAFLEKHKGQKILLFGFTFMIWQHFYKELLRLKGKGIMLDLSNGILIHGGGWKKLISEAVSQEEFHKRLRDVCGLNHIHDYYGMVEQTGCIYMQCECGHLHASVFSDVIVRNSKDFSICKKGETGIIQVISTIPESYPGHSLLTEDEGILLGEDDCPCGRKGKYFKILGRLKNAEIRGCSDTYAEKFRDSASKNAKSVLNVKRVNKEDEKGIAGTAWREMSNLDDKLATLNIHYEVGSVELLKRMREAQPRKPFADKTVDFLNRVSRTLLADREAKIYPDIVTLAFWMRKANMESLRKRFASDGSFRLGRGIAFHVAPSNVPVNYAYSLVTGLLCGNANIVRIPSKEFPQVEIINRSLKKVLEEVPEIQSYLCLVRYGHDSSVNDALSTMADVRVVWGGDRTINELRQSPLKPRATEITFADRYSFAVIDSDVYLEIEDKGRVANDFYNDTFLTDQNACTSPRAVAWCGGKTGEAKRIFWDELHRVAAEKYMFQGVQAVNKLTSAYLAAVFNDDVHRITGKDNLIYRIQVPALTTDLMEIKDNSGYFFECYCSDIRELKNFCDDTRCQTVSYIGDKDMFLPLLNCGVTGIDRIVPVGKTMDFDLIWDGYNLFERMTRTVTM